MVLIDPAGTREGSFLTAFYGTETKETVTLQRQYTSAAVYYANDSVYFLSKTDDPTSLFLTYELKTGAMK